MDDLKIQAFATKPKKRIRFGLRGLIGVILLVGLALGWFARQDRLARLQTARLAELQRMGVLVNDFRPTTVCLIAMRFFGGESNKTKDKLVRWLDPGWFDRPKGFNAGYLPDDKVGPVVERVGRFGDVVKEVRFKGWGSPELCLLYIDRVPFDRLGVPRDQVTVIDHPIMTSGLRSESP